MHSGYDIVIVGGGLSGLSLALQLKQTDGSLRILVAEKARKPAPDACHKVGESTVEISSHYFRNVLGLVDELDQQLPKYGLRFYFSENGNQKIEDRIELGSNQVPQFSSYQIDRGRFENALLAKCQIVGVDVYYGMLVKDIQLGSQNHKVFLNHSGKSTTVTSRWLVDASGRLALLKRKLNLQKNSYHNVNAAWFRIQHEIDINSWSSNEPWKHRVSVPRRLGTNHLVGDGYWVWLIPLCSGATSIGIVADAKRHSYSGFDNYQNAISWLQTHEPQCAEAVENHQPLDFLTLEHLAHNCKQLYSEDGWFVGGDAGVFVDPLYSSGNDFIAINNTMITDLINRQNQGEVISQRLSDHQNLYRKLLLAFSQIYEDQYPILGNARIMTIKIIWDFSLYWGGVALLFIQNKIADHDFMISASAFLREVYTLNTYIQRLLREWCLEGDGQVKSNQQFINYSAIGFLQVFNAKLLNTYSDSELTIELSKNLQLFNELVTEIRIEAFTDCPQLNSGTASLKPAMTNHYQEVFETFR